MVGERGCSPTTFPLMTHRAERIKEATAIVHTDGGGGRDIEVGSFAVESSLWMNR